MRKGIKTDGTLLCIAIQCSDDEKRLFCRYQEAFAAMLDHTDAQIGRLMVHLEEIAVYEKPRGDAPDSLKLVFSSDGQDLWEEFAFDSAQAPPSP